MGLKQVKVGIITVSDKSYQGIREDRGGPALEEFVRSNEGEVVFKKVVPDEKEQIKEAIKEAASAGSELILTTGGTGFSKRDVTPEATLELAERIVPGVPEYIRYKSSFITTNAILSRGVCAVYKDSVILNLPGSPKGAVESLEFVWEALVHGIEVLKGEIGEHV
jgi:molybdenum cofactor synthesis domain-containing protein